MTSDIEAKYITDNFSQETQSKIMKIIGELAGDNPNLKISFEELKFNLGKMKYSVNGEVNFNVIRFKELPRLANKEGQIGEPQR